MNLSLHVDGGAKRDDQGKLVRAASAWVIRAWENVEGPGHSARTALVTWGGADYSAGATSFVAEAVALREGLQALEGLICRGRVPRNPGIIKNCDEYGRVVLWQKQELAVRQLVRYSDRLQGSDSSNRTSAEGLGVSDISDDSNLSVRPVGRCQDDNLKLKLRDSPLAHYAKRDWKE